jgi:hypothetical protein
MTNDEAMQHVGDFLDVLVPPSNSTNSTPTPIRASTSTPNSTSTTNVHSRRITTRETRNEVENLVYDFFIANGVHRCPTMPTMTEIMAFPGYATFMIQIVSTPQILQAAASNDPNAVSNIITSAVQNVIATISHERIMDGLIS